MARYRLLAGGGVFDTQTGRGLDPVVTPVEWAEYLAWVALGNTPDPVEPVRYRLLRRGVLDRRTGHSVEPIGSTPEWEEFLAWQAAGNIADPIEPYTPTADDAAAAVEESTRRSAIQALRNESVVTFLRTHTPAETEAWVQANVTDLATARNVLSKMAMVLSLLARERLSGG